MDWFMGKNRRRDKEPGVGVTPVVGGVTEESRPTYVEDEYARERLIDIDLQPLVRLPHGIDFNEWLATHTITFFQHINLMYGAVSEFCQSTGCASMTGPGSVQYQWIDERGKKCKCTAPQYIDFVMSFCQKCIKDEAIFPTKYGNVFPVSFDTTARKMLRLQLHVLAHIYQCHHAQMVSVQLTGCLNTLTYHFLLFCREFSVVDEKELEVLDDLFKRLHHFATRQVRYDADTGTARSIDHDDAAPGVESTLTGKAAVVSTATTMVANVVVGGSPKDRATTRSAKRSSTSSTDRKCSDVDVEEENKENSLGRRHGSFPLPPTLVT